MIKLRTATVDDAKELTEIYKYYVENTVISFEYSAPDEKEFAERIQHKTQIYPFIVAEDNGRILGYAYASRLREREAYDWDAEMSVYVHKDEHSRGIGSRLFGALIEILKTQNFARLYSGVTFPNEKSQRLHGKFGFSHTGTSYGIGYKQNHWLDVLWFEKQINYFNGEKPSGIIPFPKLNPEIVSEILDR